MDTDIQSTSIKSPRASQGNRLLYIGSLYRVTGASIRTKPLRTNPLSSGRSLRRGARWPRGGNGAAHAPDGTPQAGKRRAGTGARRGVAPGGPAPQPARPSAPSDQTKWRRAGRRCRVLKGAAYPRAWRLRRARIPWRRKAGGGRGGALGISSLTLGAAGGCGRPPCPPRRAAKRRYHVNAGKHSGGPRGSPSAGSASLSAGTALPAASLRAGRPVSAHREAGWRHPGPSGSPQVRLRFL